MVTYLLYIGAVLTSSGMQAQEPDSLGRTTGKWHLRAQFAGYQGLFSVGGGPVFCKGVWHPALMYGFAPRTEGRDAVHQIILRNDVVFLPNKGGKRTWYSPAASLNLLVETGRHSYLSLPERFPPGYYMAPLPRFTLGLGGRMHRTINGPGPFQTLAFTAEIVGLDAYMWYAISERGFPLHAAFGLSFGAALRW